MDFLKKKAKPTIALGHLGYSKLHVVYTNGEMIDVLVRTGLSFIWHQSNDDFPFLPLCVYLIAFHYFFKPSIKISEPPLKI